jgi:hypothetical protein
MTESSPFAQVTDLSAAFARLVGIATPHRRDDKAVSQLEGTDPKRSKQRAHASFSLLIVEPPNAPRNSGFE